MTAQTFDVAYLRDQIIGIDTLFPTPFGQRLLVYADYTASARCLHFIENHLQHLERFYANTHTEDDVTGRHMSALLHDAERTLKTAVNAGPAYRLIATGTGATGAIDKLQQILGIAFPPATQSALATLLGQHLGTDKATELLAALRRRQPVVFVGPYEHHSNEVSWRQGLAEVIEVDLDEDGAIDLGHLEHLLTRPAFRGRRCIGSFSAASNVTGMRTDVHAIASLLHRHGAVACFDYAACAPYVEIDMAPAAGGYEGDASLDAIFLSPHKLLGGPGSSGVLIFKESLYRSDLAPTVGAGGTVDYVSSTSQDYFRDIEEREKAGTPGILQIIRAALAFQIKESLTPAWIGAREHALLTRAFARWQANPRIEILGNPDPDRRIAIVSFNIKDPRGGYLHPKLVSTLLNDLFGIQSRAGCSCAGPYGHRLLKIDDETSGRYREWILKGYLGIKPGWCRLSLHYVMDDAEADYLIDAVDFLGRYGHHFVHLYDFDLRSGEWRHHHWAEESVRLSLDQALNCPAGAPAPVDADKRKALYRHYLDEARAWADRLAPETPRVNTALKGELEALRFFSLANVHGAPRDPARTPYAGAK